MEIKWNNIVFFALTIFALWLLIHMHEEVGSFIRMMGHMGPEHPADEKIWGLIAFGLVALTLLGVITALIRNQK